MKKIAIIFSALLVFAIVACNGTKKETPATDSTTVKTDSVLVTDSVNVDTTKAEVVK